MNKVNKSFLLQLIIAVFLIGGTVAWAWINPTANPPGGGGAISVNSSGNVGIGTTAPGAKLEVVGATKFGGIINAVSNKIINLGNPTAGTDAATKDYVDRFGSVGGASPRLWGQGRVGTDVVIYSVGECTSSLNSNIKVSRSNRQSHWDSAAAACPIGWWVCTVAERGTNSCNDGGIGGIKRINCSDNAGSVTMTTQTGNSSAWVADASTHSDKYKGLTVSISSNPTPNDELACTIMPVWCCAFQ
ncbi:MAG: hypothetical protein AAB847_00025 [Patescibacteria group bacterium]